MKKMMLSLTVAAGMMTFATSAMAAQYFGQQGGIVPLGSFSYSSNTSKPTSGDSSTTSTLNFSPGVRYFVAEKIAVGGDLTFTKFTPEKGDSTTWTGLKIAGAYNIGINNDWSVFPEVSIAYKSMSIGDNSGTKTTFGLFVPFLWHAAPHFFIGIGPFYNTDISSKVKSGSTEADGSTDSAYGLMTTIGGWL